MLTLNYLSYLQGLLLLGKTRLFWTVSSMQMNLQSSQSVEHFVTEIAGNMTIGKRFWEVSLQVRFEACWSFEPFLTILANRGFVRNVNMLDHELSRGKLCLTDFAFLLLRVSKWDMGLQRIVIFEFSSTFLTLQRLLKDSVVSQVNDKLDLLPVAFRAMLARELLDSGVDFHVNYEGKS